jgi:hypothetical protein
VYVLAGYMAVTNSKLSHVDKKLGEAKNVRVTLVASGQAPDFTYRHDFRAYDAAGNQLGDPDTGIYRAEASPLEWSGRQKMTGERHRELLLGADFDLMESTFVAPDEVNADIFTQAAEQEVIATKLAKRAAKIQMQAYRASVKKADQAERQVLRAAGRVLRRAKLAVGLDKAFTGIFSWMAPLAGIGKPDGES